jgi:diguanylate cyclase (GGDEF)-like protein
VNLVAASTYWIIVILWLTILVAVVMFYAGNRKAFGTTRLLLAVLAVDAVRNIVENSYFGLYSGAMYGLLPAALKVALGNPVLLILPKIANIGAGCLVLGVLLLRWLPTAIRERDDAKRQAEALHKLATTDGLTGLYNRRQFMNLAEIEWPRCQRYGRPLSLVMLDLDHFKDINDRHGHDVGDQVLARVAELCGRQGRSADIVARVGGEEFAVLLLETDAIAAIRLAERLRTAIAQASIATTAGALSVTVSIGVSEAAAAESLTAFLKQADLALYRAKRDGRDRVCRFSPAEEPGGPLPAPA